jgi:hypothetical protein
MRKREYEKWPLLILYSNNMHRIMLALLFLTGCASLTETQCRAGAAEWKWLGRYDAVQGDQPWIEAYAEVCRSYGATVNEEAYLEGWQVGHAKFERRVNIAD